MGYTYKDAVDAYKKKKQADDAAEQLTKDKDLEKAQKAFHELGFHDYKVDSELFIIGGIKFRCFYNYEYFYQTIQRVENCTHCGKEFSTYKRKLSLENIGELIVENPRSSHMCLIHNEQTEEEILADAIMNIVRRELPNI